MSEHDQTLARLQDALQAHTNNVQQLEGLSDTDVVSQEWSSQVTRCQTQLNDSLKICKDLMFDIEVLIEEEADKCGTRSYLMRYALLMLAPYTHAGHPLCSEAFEQLRSSSNSSCAVQCCDASRAASAASSSAAAAAPAGSAQQCREAGAQWRRRPGRPTAAAAPAAGRRNARRATRHNSSRQGR